MREISLHLTDILENSVRAKATQIDITIEESQTDDNLSILVEDNGIGMEKEMLEIVRDPFVTTRGSRKVGLGISLLESACQRCDGGLDITSEKGKGTSVKAWMRLNHIDRMPLGRIEDTIGSLLLYEGIEVVYTHKTDTGIFELDTREVRKVAGDDLGQVAINNWIREYIKENLEEINTLFW